MTFVTTLSYKSEWAHLDDVRRWCENLIPISVPNRRSILHRVAYKIWYAIEASWDGYDFRDLYLVPRALQTQVIGLLQRQHFDVLLVEYWYMARNIMDHVPRHVLTVVDSHDVQFVRRERLAGWRRAARGGFPRRAFQWWLARYRLRETEMLNRFDLVIAISPHDADLLSSVLKPEKETETIPTGVNLEYFAPTRALPNSQIVTFVGAMRSGPNVDAALYLCREILPLINREAPSARLFLVGDDPAQEVRGLAAGGEVHVTGYVEDLRSYYEQSQVVVLPLRKGSGLKGRILEAMAMGRPVVTTPNGIEGIEHIPGENVVVAERPEEIARWTVKLLREPELGRTIGENARRWVVARYSMDRMGNQFLAVLRKRFPKAISGLASTGHGDVAANG